MVGLEVAEPGAWVVNGDLDLALRGDAVPGAELRDRLVALLAEDRGEDRFLFEVGPAQLAATTQHFAEKLHALTRDYGAQLNTRIRDPVDLRS